MKVKELKEQLVNAGDNDEVYTICNLGNPIVGDGLCVVEVFTINSNNPDIKGFYLREE